MINIFLVLFMVYSFFFAIPAFSQEPIAKSQPAQDTSAAVQPQQSVEQPQAQMSTEETLKGTVKEIAADGSYMVIDSTKILTTKELLEDSYLEVGDKVEVIAEKTDAGLKAKSCNYIFEEEEAEPTIDTNAPGTENVQ